MRRLRSFPVVLAMLVAGPAMARGARPLRRVADLPLPGRASRFDYAALDPATGLLYLDHMGAGVVVVFDTRTRKVVRVLSGFPRCTGNLSVPSLGRLFVSAAGRGQVVAVDTATDEVVARLPAPGFPDGLAYDPGTRRVFVSEEMGGAVTVIDAARLRVVGRVKLGGQAGNTKDDPEDHRVYTNDQTDGDLVVIDPETLRIERRIPLGLKGNHGLYLDLPRHLAFIASEDDDVLLVLDLSKGKVVARFEVGHAPDVLAFDPGLRRLYVASERGKLVVLQETRDGVKRLGDQDVGPNAHVVVVDPRTHLVYLPLGRLHGRPVLRIMAPAAYP